MQKNTNIIVNYKIFILDTSCLKGLTPIVDDFMGRLPKSVSLSNSVIINKTLPRQGTARSFQTTHKNPTYSTYQSTYPSKKTNAILEKSVLEQLYCHLGHELYTKLLKLFERYCLYAKSVTNFIMDFSQFQVMLGQNNIYDEKVTKNQMEVLFNKAKNTSKCKNNTK